MRAALTQNVSANIQKSRIGAGGQNLGRAHATPRPIEHAQPKAPDNFRKQSPELNEVRIELDAR